MRIGFAGLSHLGIVSSIAAASKGFEVLGYDPDSALCEGLNAGTLPVSEPQLPELLAANRSRIRFTAEAKAVADCELVIISSDIPTTPENRSDLSAVRQLLTTVAAHAASGTTVVVLSQVPPGFTRGIAKTFAHEAGDKQLRVFYQVETLVFGCAVERALTPERFIVGCEHPAERLPQAYATYLAAFGCPVLPMRYEGAELAKIAINMFLVSSVSTANTLAELCEAIKADWSEIVPALRLDRRIGPHAYLSPGLGIAGGNLERDLMTVKELAGAHGTDAGVVDAWLANSRARRDWTLRTLHAEVLSQCEHPVIAVWGLAYKADTRSIKNSPSVALIDSLAPFPVHVYDPQVVLNGQARAHVSQVRSALDACRGAEALAIMTPWQEFSSVRLAQLRELMAGRTILDPFGVLRQAACTEAGFRYFRLGVPVETRSA